MNGKKTLVFFLFFFFVLFQIIDLQSQSFQKNIQIKWTEPLTFEDTHGTKHAFLYFEQSVSSPDFQELPMYFERIPAPAAYEQYDVQVENEVYLPLTAEEMRLVPSGFQAASLNVNVYNSIDKKKNFTTVTFIPLRMIAGGRYEKLVSVSLTVTPRSGIKNMLKSRTYAANSVLQSGTWYKVGVKNTGIYRITCSELKEMGLISQQVASSNISVFGNGGGMLPEANSQFRYDDLQELPIMMFDGGDGAFNGDDYFLFYAEGPHSWKYNSFNQSFEHLFNLYSDVACYFVNVEGRGVGKRIAEEDNYTLTSNVSVATYDAYGFYEEDLLHIGDGGRNWYGDKFDAARSERSYTLNLPPSLTEPARLTLDVAAASARSSSFSIAVNGQSVGTLSVRALVANDWAESAHSDFSFFHNGIANLTLTYNQSTYSSIGYLNYLEWQAHANLTFFGEQMPFCNIASVRPGNITQFSIGNMTPAVRVWDVTAINDVKQMAGDLSGSAFTFKAPTDTLRKFFAFSTNSYYTVSMLGRVAPQNLHGTSQTDMIIVSYPDFLIQAERLADFHRQHDGLSVKVVTPQEVYNEFSSGAQDITAIRDYMRMIYDKSNAQYPSYLLLFGRPSYDYRNIIGDCKLYVPNYQSASAMDDNSLRANDDYFGLLDENEGANCIGMVDLSIGRFPAATLEQARIAVDKTIQYSSAEMKDEGLPTSNYGDWKNVLAFVADDEDGTTHVYAADQSAVVSQTQNPDVNIHKMYLDAYQQVTYSASQRYPDATADINRRMNRGCLLFTYVGHGGKSGWAAERVIELADIRAWNNRYNLPWMVTLTCEFGWYDRVAVSPAELAFFNEHGGAAGMVTTSRVAFTGSNQQYGTNFYTHVFDRVNGRPISLGEINRIAKNNAGGAMSSLNMLYVLGDPAMQLKVPVYKVITDSINGIAAARFTDTLKALSHVAVVGHIEDVSGNHVPGFAGSLLPSIYDKKVTSHTLQNDAGSNYFEFEEQKNVLFKGNVTITDGRFRFQFVLPKDINYAYGAGKFSYYAYGQNMDATGSYSGAIIGGLSTEGPNDQTGPDMEVYMNDERFVNGGLVNSSPTLLLKLKDEYGINTTGSGIGHDLVAIMDDGSPVVLNDYYVAERDSFNCGTVRYPYTNLSLGKHTMKVRAWDILNNVTEKTIEFVVESEEGLKLEHVLNYPNPFTTHTSFYFEHNQPNKMLDVVISIFTVSGKLVKTLQDSQCNEGFRSDPIEWDGLDDYGDRIGKGTYLYRLKVKTQDGQQIEKFEKIVIL